MEKVSENNAQKIRELLNSLELAAYGDISSKHHQYPNVQLFKNYAQQLFDLSDNIEFQFPKEDMKLSFFNLMDDCKRSVMYDLETFEVKKAIGNQEVCYFLESILTKIKEIYEPLLGESDNNV